VHVGEIHFINMTKTLYFYNYAAQAWA